MGPPRDPGGVQHLCAYRDMAGADRRLVCRSLRAKNCRDDWWDSGRRCLAAELGRGFAAHALYCRRDLRIAGRSALTTAFAKVGLSGDYGGTWFLTQLVGAAKARELYFLSDVLDAARIEALGLANRVVADAELAGETMALAERLANGPAIALRYMKRNLNVALHGTLSEGLDSEAYGMLRSRASDDHKEAARAFVEKRAPVFVGR